jgi:peptidoglycan glycosyltransferase
VLRRRRRPVFTTASRQSPWLQPARSRRRRRHVPVVPLLALAVLLAAVAGALLYLRARHAAADRQRTAVVRFAAAWSRGDRAAMWRLTSAQSRRADDLAQFSASYDDADRRATVTAVRTGPVGALRDGHVPVPVVVRTRLFGELRGTLSFPVRSENGGAYVAWSRALRLPGLRGDEMVSRRVLRRPATRPVLAAGGGRLDAEPAAAAIARGLESQYADRLGGRPGAELLFGSRLIRRVSVRRGHSVRATIVPAIQRAATAALGTRLGGIAVVRPRTGDVLALAGLAVSAPQPPGSTFKIITLATALEAGIARPDSSYPVQTFTTLSGVKLRNAGDEACGGGLSTAFAVSCNSVFAPLGARLGAGRLVRSAERFGFNERLAIPALRPSTIPSRLRDDLEVGASAIGQGRVLATPLEMASVGAAIGNRGLRARPRLVRDERVRRRRAVGARAAGQVRDMMLAVVRAGTGTAAALPGVEVAGKTGTAELRPTAGGPPDPKNTDAWFVAFAPASRPTVAVAVMLVGAGHGGEAAAPLARSVLAAALR